MRLVEDFYQKGIGAKAHNLYRMQKLGLPVPTFCAYSFSIFDSSQVQAFLSQMTREMREPSADLQALSTQLLAWVDRVVEHEDFDKVTLNLEEQKLYAVRSSANLEDSSNMSFAGQFESQLNVSPDQVGSAMLTVLKSLYQVPALAYYRQHHLSLDALRMTVIVQEQIESDFAGIYFTANPKGLLSQEVIVYGKGLGNQIVEDRLPTTHIYYHPLEKVTYYEQAQGAPLLDQTYQAQLLSFGASLKQVFGPYLDIEFAIVNNQVYLLQVRPITGLDEENLVILDNSNIVESYPGTTTPLTISFAQEAYRSIFTQLAKRITHNQKRILQAYEETFAHMVSPYYQRLYYQIQNWYQLLQLLPFSKRIIPIWQEMLGVEQMQVPQTPLVLTLVDRVRVGWQLGRAFHQAPAMMEQLEQDFKRVETNYRAAYHDGLPLNECQALFTQLKTQVLDQWDITLVNDLYAFIYTGLLKKIVGDQIVQAQIANIEQIASMGPAYALQDLYESLHKQENTAFRRALLRAESKSQYDELWQFQVPIVAELEGFIDKYGDRSPEELKMETVTFRSQPNRLLVLLRDYQPLAFKVISHDEQVKGPFYCRGIQKRAMRGIGYRESSRLNRTRIYGMMRQLFLTAGQRLVEQGYLEEVEDIHYLSLDQVFEVPNHVDSYRQQVLAAKETLRLANQVPAFSRLVFIKGFFQAPLRQVSHSQASYQSENYWLGTGCASGRIRAQVLVIDRVDQVSHPQGKIIVTRMTDPGWVYLLSQSAGIIAEQGSLLSHTAIISRELGIPSVVGIKGIMAQVQDGQWLEMDGQTGQVWRVEE